MTVKAAYSKNRRECAILLRPQSVVLLHHHLNAKSPNDRAFAMPERDHVAKIIRADLDAARTKWLEQAGSDEEERKRRINSDFLTYKDHDGRIADFHALRHTFISNLAAGGIHPKTAQVLARHSTFALTMERYSHSQRGNEVAALKTLPELPVPEKPEEQKTGAYENQGDSVLAICLLQNGTLEENSGDSGRLSAPPRL